MVKVRRIANPMNPLEKLLQLPKAERQERGMLYTPAEIARQPGVWPSTLGVIEDRIDEIRSFLEACGLKDNHSSRPAITLIGAGTSDYVGQCLVALLRDQWQCDVQAVPSTTLLTSFAEYIVPEKPRLWISFSRSGSSPEGVAVLQRALAEQPQIAHIVISCDGAGSMAQMIRGHRHCLSLVLGKETNDQGLAMTGSFTNLLISGHALAHAWSLDSYRSTLDGMCRVALPFLDQASTLAASLASMRFQSACFLGSGDLAGLAAESALKVLELSCGNVKTMSETTLGLRHGPMAALDEQTLLVLFLSSDEARRRYEYDLLREIEDKKIVGLAIAVSASGPCNLDGLHHTRLLAPDTTAVIPDFYSPAVDVLFGQCLGLFASLEFGLAPDTPSPNGVLSRVVPSFGIH
jgi:tagatose-6-phosphate ketose/aldose isomerase